MCVGASTGSPYLSTLCDVFTLLPSQIANGINSFLFTRIFNSRAICAQIPFNWCMNVSSVYKLTCKLHNSNKISPSISIPEATHSKTLRRASPAPSDLSDVPIAFSTSSSSGYVETRRQNRHFRMKAAEMT